MTVEKRIHSDDRLRLLDQIRVDLNPCLELDATTDVCERAVRLFEAAGA